MVVLKRKANSHATPDEPLRRAPERTTQWKIYLSCRRGFMVEYLSWNSFYCFKCYQKICEIESSPFTILFVLWILFFRTVYERASKSLRNAEEKEERVMVLEAWKEFEVLLKLVVWIRKLFWKVESYLILLIWSFRTNMETKAHKKKSRKRCLAE